MPNETFKAAAHLVVTGKKRRFSRVKILLAHLGGSTPFLAPRVAVLSAYMGCTMSPEECIKEFQTFYFDTALSAHASTLGMQGMTPDRLLLGTDFPGTCNLPGYTYSSISGLRSSFTAVSTEMAAWYTQNVDEYYADNSAALAAVNRENALRLFPRLRMRIEKHTEE